MPVINGTGGSPTPTPTPPPTPPAIPLVGTGGLFTRIGKFGGLIDAINEQRGTTIPAHVSAVNAQYASANQDVVTNLYTNLASYQTSSGSFMTPIRQMATNTIIEMVNESQLLPTPSLAACMSYLIADMVATSNTVNANAVGGSISFAGTNTGNPVVVVSLRGLDGRLLENVFDELIIGTVTNDSTITASVAGIEPIFWQGQAAISDTLSWLYAEGSGCAFTTSAVSPLTQPAGGTANWVVNGSMETFTIANTPNNWAVVVGTPGTTVFKTTFSGTFYDGVSALQFLGNGSELTQIRQKFAQPGVTGDMTFPLQPRVQVAVNLFLKVSAVPSTGVLRVAMTDSAGTVILDDNGGSNSYSVDLTAIGTGWMSGAWAFRTPLELTSPVYLDIRLTTALETGKSVYIDRVGLAQMTQAYAGGPYFAVMSGNVNLVKGDTIFVGITNSYSGKFQVLFDRLFGMKAMGLLLPSNAVGGETISDGLIS